jgi:hypothetical protein
MSIRIPTMVTAGLLGALLAAGSLTHVHAGDGCGKDKQKDDGTSALQCPATTAAQPVSTIPGRP